MTRSEAIQQDATTAAATELFISEEELIRSLQIAEAVTKACEARGVAAPGAVAMADRELQLSILNWQDKLRDYLAATGREPTV